MAVHALHDEIEELVQRVVQLNEELNRDFERQSDEARTVESGLRARAKVVVIGCFALAIATAAGVGLVMTRSILGRISRLRAGAMEIAKGNLATRIDILGRDEFAELATSFNHMAGELARHQRQLMRSQRLATLGHVAAGVAHEINNPLGVILGYAKLLRAGAQTESDTTEGLRIIEDEAHQCQRIVEGLLTLARTPKLHLSEVDLAELAGEAIERLKETGKLDGLRVETASSNTSVHAWGDEAKLRQVIANVLVNAAEATTVPGAIRVDAANEGDSALLQVTDTGPGIPKDVRPRIFDPFFTTKPTGTGLGLAISQAIIEAHGGTIEIHSEEGSGTRVTIRMPRDARPVEGAAT
jgi:signal transduction histidine kinase